jgi:hypothetical protein
LHKILGNRTRKLRRTEEKQGQSRGDRKNEKITNQNPRSLDPNAAGWDHTEAIVHGLIGYIC